MASGQKINSSTFQTRWDSLCLLRSRCCSFVSRSWSWVLHWSGEYHLVPPSSFIWKTSKKTSCSVLGLGQWLRRSDHLDSRAILFFPSYSSTTTSHLSFLVHFRKETIEWETNQVKPKMNKKWEMRSSSRRIRREEKNECIAICYVWPCSYDTYCVSKKTSCSVLGLGQWPSTIWYHQVLSSEKQDQRTH
jgi:hypothetical protein